jgi:hypothetical protein
VIGITELLCRYSCSSLDPDGLSMDFPLP